MKPTYILCMLAFVAASNAAPLHDIPDLDPELSAGYFEGDMILDDGRNGLRNESARWPNNVVYYRIADGFFDEEHRDKILLGMRSIEAVSCIRFQEADSDQSYFIYITGEPRGCAAEVGFKNRVQRYNLDINAQNDGCFRPGTVIHELLHTLGFHHMQSSWNRDEYVRIAEENIIEKYKYNFEKYDAGTVDDFGIEYDYGSVMHYPAKAASANGQDTIIALKDLPGADTMGQRETMSESDIRRLNIMYRCPSNV